MNEQYVVRYISQTRQNMHKYIESELKREGLDDLIPSHGSILTALYTNKKSLTMKEIAEKIGKDKSTVTVLVNHLLYRGYIKKKENPEDKRITLIELTEFGLSCEEKYSGISKNVIETAYRGFSNEEKKQFLNLLKRLNTNFVENAVSGGKKDEANE